MFAEFEPEPAETYGKVIEERGTAKASGTFTLSETVAASLRASHSHVGRTSTGYGPELLALLHCELNRSSFARSLTSHIAEVKLLFCRGKMFKTADGANG